MQTRTATCVCGQLRAICQGDPPRVALCDCTQCQKRTGSVYGVAGYFMRDQVRTEGTFKRFQRSSDAGRHLDFAFCPECGSTVFWELEMFPDRIAVAVGAFADPSFPAPIVAVWTANRYHWVSLPEGVPQHLGAVPQRPEG
jgi:hypothetical protein